MIFEILLDNLSVVLVFLVVTFTTRLFLTRPKDLPPGPWFTLPVLGNLLQVGTNPVKSFRKLRKKYGDVFSVYIGTQLVIAVNGFKNMKDVFVKKGDLFSNRPDILTIKLLSDGKGIIGSSGDVWREQRHFALTTLKNLGMGKNILEGKIQEEISAFLEQLRKTKGEATNFRQLICTSVSNVISSIVFGRRFEFDDPEFVQFIKVMEQTASLPIALSLFPFLHYLPGDLFGLLRRKKDIDLLIQDLADKSLEKHLAQYDENNITDFISAYIKEMKAKAKRGEINTGIDRENLRLSIWNLFAAGTETTATTLRWLLVFFQHHPEIQKKCFSEIQKKIGCDRLITLQDKTELTYIEATILETLRLGDLVPLSLYRGVQNDIYWNGYRIPHNAVVYPVIDSVLSDPEIWGDPENFRPERFLDENGHLVNREELIPFMFGPRNCIGEPLARMELFLFVSNMIQKFEFIKPEGSPLPSMEPILGFTQSPKPFKVRAVLRK